MGQYLYGTNGKVQNVFIRTSGNNAASYLYYNDQEIANNVINCTFFHDLGKVSSSYSGICNFFNIATNVITNSNSQNVIEENFGDIKTPIQELIKNSKNNSTFNENKVGVYYGIYAWE